VLVFNADLQLSPKQTAAGVHVHVGRVGNKTRVDEQRHAFTVDAVIRIKILTSEVGVDRHLGDATSTNGRNEINGSGAALGSDPFDGVVSHVEVHTSRTPHEALQFPHRCTLTLHVFELERRPGR
jgi:hypothetical protein